MEWMSNTFLKSTLKQPKMMKRFEWYSDLENIFECCASIVDMHIQITIYDILLKGAQKTLGQSWLQRIPICMQNQGWIKQRKCLAVIIGEADY